MDTTSLWADAVHQDRHGVAYPVPIEEADPVLLDDPEYGTALDGGKALDKAKQALRDVLVPMVVAASTGWTCRLLRRAEAIGVPGDRHASYVVTSRLAGQETETP